MDATTAYFVSTAAPVAVRQHSGTAVAETDSTLWGSFAATRPIDRQHAAAAAPTENSTAGTARATAVPDTAAERTSRHPGTAEKPREALPAARLSDSFEAAADNPATTRIAAGEAASGITADPAQVSPGGRSVQDSLASSAHAETAPWSAAPFALLPDAGYRPVGAAEVFGTGSMLVPATSPTPRPAPSLTDNAVFQGFVLLLAATYAMLLYRNLNDVRLLIARVLRDRSGNERLDEQHSSGFSRFLNVAMTIGLFFIGVIAVKYGDTLMPARMLELFSHGAVLALTLLTALVFLAVGVYQTLLLRLIGAVTLSQPFIAQLIRIKRGYVALVVLVASPVLLLYALCPPDSGKTWFYAGLALLLITILLYVRESLILFISKKISILHWFLYLCTVEVFPFSLLWLLGTR